MISIGVEIEMVVTLTQLCAIDIVMYCYCIVMLVIYSH